MTDHARHEETAATGMKADFANCWYLSGPTAGGKTLVGLELARRLNAEIISLDSMAIYREMNIGTAKPNREQRAAVPHHLIDILAPNERFSVSDYVAAARRCVREIRARGREVLFVGGTPLYLKSLLRGMFEGPPADPDFRQQVEAELKDVGVSALHERLKQVDPLSAAKLHPNDKRRIIRALEVYKTTNQPISHLQMQFDEGRDARYCRVFILDWPRDQLHERIDNRVHRMFQSGLVEEVVQIQQTYGGFSKTSLQAVGYQEVVDHLEHRATLSETIERTKVRTRQFAKRQLTWFRSLSECRWVERRVEILPDVVAEGIIAAGQLVGLPCNK